MTAQINDAHARGLTAPEAAALLDMTLKQFVGVLGGFRMRHLHWQPPRKPPPERVWPPDRVAMLRALLETPGITYGQAARQLGATVGAIAGAVRDHIRNKAAPHAHKLDA